MRTLVSSVLAGISIFLGAFIFLSVDNKIIGSLLFSIGLFVVCTGKLNLYTGKICYCFNNIDLLLSLPIIWIGNAIGAFISALLVSHTRIYDTIAPKAQAICDTKLNDSYLSLFLLGIVCNIFIFIAVHEYNNNKHELGKYLAIIFGVMGFILVGSEHCVADMCYISIAQYWTGEMIKRLLIITLGNSIGGILAYLSYSYIKL